MLGKRLRDWDVVLGLVATVAFTAVGTTALSWVRKRNYRVFYTVHVTLATALLPILYFHVHHIRVFVWETLVVYGIHFLTRVLAEKRVDATVSLVPGTSNLLDIIIPLSSSKPSQRGQKAKGLLKWEAGQHVYLSQHKSGLFTRPLKTKNPFTIASLPSEDGHVRLIARIMDGNTAALATAAKCSKPDSTIPLMIEGPYGLTTHSANLLPYSRVLFVAGGVGASFVLPLYRSLLKDLSPSAGSRRRQGVRFGWVVRSVVETAWAIPKEESEAKGVKERMTVWVTRGEGADGNADGVGRSEREEVAARGKLERSDEEEESIEMERLLPGGGAEENSGVQRGRELDVKYGRPDLRGLVNETFAGTDEKDKIAVFVCGPKGLARDVRKEVGRWIEKREVWFWSEEFGL